MEIHRCRFADYVPKSINSIRFTPKTWSGRPYMAVGRANGDIELWNCVNGFSLERIIPGPTGINLESMVWSHQIELSENDKLLYDTEAEQKSALADIIATPPRLFTAGLNGAIIEWCLSTMLPKTAVDSYGGAVWCMSVNNAQTIIAVGTDDGYVRLFDIADGNLSYLRSLDPIERRILSMCWSNDDSYIYCGSTDGSIRKYDVNKGQIVSRMTTIRGKKDVPLVWSVVMLPDNTLVSGDSRGNVIFWDTLVDVALQFFTSHSADVLCLEYDQTLDAVYASGVDQKVVQFLPSSDYSSVKNDNDLNLNNDNHAEGPKTWVQVGSRRAHTHDIRSIAVNSSNNINAIVSGGVDGRISIIKASKFIHSSQIHMPAFPTNNNVLKISETNQIMIMQMENELKLWKLASNNNTDINSVGKSNSNAQLLIKLQLQTASSIVTSAISSNGRLVAVSDNREVKLFKVIGDFNNPETICLEKIEDFFKINDTIFKSLAELPRFATQLHFTSDNKKLIIATSELILYVISIDERTITSETTQETLYDYEFNTIMANYQHRVPYDTILDDENSNSTVTKDNIHVFLNDLGMLAEKKTSKSYLRSFCSINAISSCLNSRWLATSDTSGKIIITDLSNLSINAELPILENSSTDIPTSVTFVHKADNTDELAIAFSSQKVLLWDILNNSIAEWSVLNPSKDFPQYFKDLKYKISGLVSSVSEPGIIYAWGTDYMVKIDTNISVSSYDLVYDINERQKAQELIVTQVKAEFIKACSDELSFGNGNSGPNKKRKPRRKKAIANNAELPNNGNDTLTKTELHDFSEKEKRSTINGTLDSELAVINFKLESNLDNKPISQVNGTKKSRRLVKKTVEVSSTENNSSASLNEYFNKYFDNNLNETDSKKSLMSNDQDKNGVLSVKRKYSQDTLTSKLKADIRGNNVENIKDEIKAVAISRLLDAGVITENDQFNFSYTKKYNPIMSLGFIAPGKLAIVERPWFDMLSALPPALARKKFGN
ncbi:hypothetical protein BB561_003119 [Smittium simulii]|uniref:Uncharacterized protein n=1 Tax=Smittium simulii TaxID=133385 RepID=A0A2T9YN18_9FUNG|nr:hypothetical protein BB561_003119 [Smittium simulii]